MSRVLVTGADGFIGRAVCAALADKGHHVIAGTRDGRPVEGARECRRLGDLGRPEGMDSRPAGAEAIVHLAARVHVMKERSPDSMAEYRRVNIDGTRCLAEAAERAGVRRLIFLSTIKVNGEATTGRPFSEADPPDPRDSYAASKWQAEQVLASIGNHGKLEIVVLRVPLVYGPGVKANFLSLLRLCDTPLPLPFGAITGNRRSLIYVENLADAVVSSLHHADAAGGTFTVSDGAAVSTAELVRTIRRALDRPARLLSVPPGLLRAALSLAGKAAAADRLTDSLELDDGAIVKALEWRAPWSFQEGIAETAAWYRSARKN
jgi:UDP-glucose 4-epimerase